MFLAGPAGTTVGTGSSSSTSSSSTEDHRIAIAALIIALFTLLLTIINSVCTLSRANRFGRSQTLGEPLVNVNDGGVFGSSAGDT